MPEQKLLIAQIAKEIYALTSDVERVLPHFLVDSSIDFLQKDMPAQLESLLKLNKYETIPSKDFDLMRAAFIDWLKRRTQTYYKYLRNPPLQDPYLEKNEAPEILREALDTYIPQEQKKADTAGKGKQYLDEKWERIRIALEAQSKFLHDTNIDVDFLRPTIAIFALINRLKVNHALEANKKNNHTLQSTLATKSI